MSDGDANIFPLLLRQRNQHCFKQPVNKSFSLWMVPGKQTVQSCDENVHGKHQKPDYCNCCRRILSCNERWILENSQSHLQRVRTASTNQLNIYFIPSLWYFCKKARRLFLAGNKRKLNMSIKILRLLDFILVVWLCSRSRRWMTSNPF